MAVVAASLHRQRIQVFLYLDDWLTRGCTREQVTIAMFCQMGLLLNVEKSTLEPTHRIEFIGAVLDSRLAKALLPESHFQSLANIIRSLQSFPSSTVKTYLSLLLHMASCT
ncbi:hypothetical protein KIL84_022521 [Mauremys mutica]|uniref:Reverse transcriptase domain-containing protein n=1 Tax=Mauremys mutica TaxID=74926 RepID=A0A9D3WNG9_9SAUR|nr:hypothetical protein KIL84_022521 [Mauremys mutica]